MPGPSVASRVVRWQREHGRHDLPWQVDRDPYKVWLSEVMLQQTQVATVKAFFQRFLTRFPSVEVLAQAPLDDVLGAWSGLGYYSRARNLHRCAQIVVTVHGGQFPRDPALLAELPGIGRSTAAAIAALCFGVRAAILDGNVRRVLSRLDAVDGDLRSAGRQQLLWRLAESLLPRHKLAETMPVYTQGLMDLGATVCLPRAPRCSSCPLQSRCRAQVEGDPARYPARGHRAARTSHSLWLLWAHDDTAGVWLQRRPARGIWGGLHCLPCFDSREALLAAVPESARGGLVELPPRLHLLTHRDLYLHPVRWSTSIGGAVPQATRHCPPGEWRALGLPAPVRGWLDQDCNQPKDVVG